MKRKIGTAILVSALAQLALADSTVQQAQEELKEQGYYFGQINGDKNADTVAAIRRFQIRNGLQVTGELDQETLRALHAASASSTAATTPTPQPRNLEDSGNTTERVAPATSPPRDLQTYRAQPAPAESATSIFRNTPYEMAPPELQQRVILGAQTLLRRRGSQWPARYGHAGCTWLIARSTRARSDGNAASARCAVGRTPCPGRMDSLAVFEVNRLQFGGDGADKNLALDSQEQSIVVI
ncbi:MAG: hypothetical protein DMF27_04330 [Verrucomicrobia bacterium]|nr:MAG: hypothetical protein DMF27_04330 [Verrucomicrobiota bacterium]